MLKTPLLHKSQAVRTLTPWSKPFLTGHGFLSLPIAGKPAEFSPKQSNVGYSSSKSSSTVKAISTISTEKSAKVKAIVTVQMTVGGLLSNIGPERGMDDIADLFGRSILVELVSTELEPKTGLEKGTIPDYGQRVDQEGDEVTYECEFVVPADFGEIGAVFVQNQHHKEMFIKDILIDGLLTGPVKITCESWVHSKFDNPEKRIFYSNKSYLPSQTPSGLRRIREEELIILQGNGQGERKKHERIYEYDVYNDLGEPDKDPNLARPVLGGKAHPYPRRCRTGRPRTRKDLMSETRSRDFYVPRDECFAEVKQMTFGAKTIDSLLHMVVPSIECRLVDPELGFPYFTAIDLLYNEGIHLPEIPKNGKFFNNVLPRLVRSIKDIKRDILRFETPEMIDRDKFSWFRDEEFARQTLAGLNPYSLRLVTEWPLKSKLDPEIYGPPESAITKEMIELQISGFMSLDEAIKQKKLFMLDYHDLLLPYVKKVRELKGRTLYGSRTLFFLNPDSTLRPVAIELARPPMDGKPQWKKAYFSSWDATGCWLWRLAKAHVLAHDSGYHQLVSHWLRTHCCVEPYIIASHRQLSAMHPIFRLLEPHFRYTMEINGMARRALINADGIIESSFAPGKYSLEFSSVAYDQQWQFNLEALPADLISRGLAEEDPSSPHGLKLLIEDYPFANDGLILWDAIKQWVTDYVNHYYPDPSEVQSDQELQAWWTEIRTVGHGDKKDEPWWPKLETPEDLIGILTIIIWVPSGHHAAVNFGQYHFAGYFPNRPTITRAEMPDEDPTDEQWKLFQQRPEVALLETFPSQIQATKVMAILDVLSTHSPDEEYIGEAPEPSWADDPVIKAAFERYSGKLKELEGIIDARNADSEYKNRSGAGIVPYELLKPYSEPGVTGKGVPNSISI